MNGYSVLDQWAHALRSSGRSVPGILTDVADALRADTAAQVARGFSPDGAKWAAKRDGSAPLVGAATNLRSQVQGSTAYVEVGDWVHVLHHSGKARRAPARPMLPSSLTPAMAARIGKLAEAVVRRALSSG